MRVFTCNNCMNTLYFENSKCLHCEHPVGFNPMTLSMVTLKPSADEPARFSNASNDSEIYKYCSNSEHGVCNWLLPGDSEQDYCVACAMNNVIPSLDSDINRLRWKNIEIAKHRLIHSLLRLQLPFEIVRKEKHEALSFNFMADAPSGERVMTGHDNGIITINIIEADEAERAKNKYDLGERYRTLLGHFRHESGHFYWDVLIRDSSLIKKYRQLFGDEQQDYPAALAAYYENGAPADWNQYFVSPYAAAHPWEDWAETWAHYLHMMDTLETAWSFGIRIDPVELDNSAGIRASILKEPYGITDFNQIIKRWLPLCFAVNSLNRSMGHPDFYPFVLSPAVIEKLRFIHDLCQVDVKS
jgi:hypothetical protein